MDSLRFQHLLASMSFLLLFNLGATRLDMYLLKNESLNQLNINAYKAQLILEPEVKTNSTRTVLEVYQVFIDTNWVDMVARVNAYFSKDIKDSLTYGDLVIVKGKPNATSTPANPGEFDYGNYLAYQNIRFQQFIGDEFQKTGHSPPNRLVDISIPIRDYCVNQIGTYIPNTKAKAVVLALVLGVKDELDNELIQSFSSTGAMHVLAVSGLHVGIIYAIVFGLMKYLRLNKRKYRWWMAIISVSILWGYAILTGLSPSVLRAVTMFTFVALGRALFRKGNIYNTLAISAMVLLLFNPYLIMSVGFQLSYLAVFGIVFLHPKIYGLIRVQHKLLDKIWSITCVSIAAQVATGPLSLLYFHQFPTYFLLSNLFIIPAAFVILIGGLILLAGSWYSPLGIAIGWLLNGFVKAINWMVNMASQLPSSTIDGVYLSTLDTWFIYMLLLGVILFLITRRKSHLRLGLIAAVAFSVSQILHFEPYAKSIELSILDVNNSSVMDLRVGFSATLIADSAFMQDPEKQRFHLQGKRLISGERQDLKEGVEIPSQQFPFGKLFFFEGKSILWLNEVVDIWSDSTDKISIDYLVISNNAVSTMSEVDKFFLSKNVIIDRTNSFYVQRQLIEELKESDSNLHQVATNGYFSSIWKN
ncbi:MAG TPA: ComEC/Rec2 family competence protein [Roseivirga sp.]